MASSKASNAMPLREAAVALGIPPRRLRYLVKQPGAPIVKHGRRSRGNPTLVDPDAFRNWTTASLEETSTAGNAELAHSLVQEIAAAVAANWRATSGPGKRQAAADAVRYFFAAANAARRPLRLDELEGKDVPPEIIQMTRLVSFEPSR